MGIIEFLKTMSIRNKIKVISVFPLIFIIILSFFLNFNTYKKVNQLEDMKELANLNVKISLLNKLMLLLICFQILMKIWHI